MSKAPKIVPAEEAPRGGVPLLAIAGSYTLADIERMSLEADARRKADAAAAAEKPAAEAAVPVQPASGE